MKEVFGIGINIPSDEDDFINTDSLSSLSECDLAIFDLTMPNYNSENQTYIGKTCYNQDSSAKIEEHSEHWKKEITSYLNRGKTLFVILSEKKDFYIHTGKKSFTGTGRNRQTTNHVKLFNNYNFLPNINLKFGVAHGKKIIGTPLFSNFLKNFETFISYQTYILPESDFEIGFTTKGGDKILGGVLNQSDGHIVFLPNISFNENSLITSTGNFTQKAKLDGLRFKQFVVEIDKNLKTHKAKSPKPEWISDKNFSLKTSIDLEIQIQLANSNLQKIEKKILSLNSRLEETEKLKDLLFETGKPLEEAVLSALRILEFSAENFDDGILELDQVIISPEGIRYIGECEGKDNKPIDITKFRQLSDALNEDFERDEVEQKAFGILFGNPYRNTLPSKRSEPFTTKCIAGAAREKIALFPTYELYKITKYILENDDDNFKKKCRETIYENLGKIIYFELPTIKSLPH